MSAPNVPSLFTVDAFSDRPFSGNPAAVCLLSEPADEAWMRLLAREMNLSETAFLWSVEGGFSLRWFTPTTEVDLCGHATLASAHVLWERGLMEASQSIRFHTRSGLLGCVREGAWISMDFPAKPCSLCEEPSGLVEALGCPGLAFGFNGTDYLVEVKDEAELRAISPDHGKLARIPARGVIVTAASGRAEFDFVSRFFAPGAGVPEDPVTGSAHCALGPYWAMKTGRKSLTAFQASERGGVVRVSVGSDRVTLKGRAVLMTSVDLLHWSAPSSV